MRARGSTQTGQQPLPMVDLEFQDPSRLHPRRLVRVVRLRASRNYGASTHHRDEWLEFQARLAESEQAPEVLKPCTTTIVVRQVTSPLVEFRSAGLEELRHQRTVV